MVSSSSSSSASSSSTGYNSPVLNKSVKTINKKSVTGIAKSHSFKSRLKIFKTETNAVNCNGGDKTLPGNHYLTPSKSLPDVVHNNCRKSKSPPNSTKMMTHFYSRPRAGSLDAGINAVRGNLK